MLPATSSIQMSNPHFLSYIASYEVASNICQVLARHVIDTHLESSFVE